MQRKLTLSLQLAMILAGGDASAARRFITDYARIVDRGGCQIETFYKVIFDLAYHAKSRSTLPVHGRTPCARSGMPSALWRSFPQRARQARPEEAKRRWEQLELWQED